MMMNKVNARYYKSASKNFEILCISLLVDAYRSAIIDKRYNVDWKENSFTKYIVSFIHTNPVTAKNKLFVKLQPEPENDNFPIEGMEDDPDKQPRIDIWLGSWSIFRNEYYIEAKNICNNDWTKSNGSKVSASKLKRRYIKTGIDNFTSKRYPNGCLAGYVINSNTFDCVNGINKLLKKDNRRNENLVNCKILEGFENSFTSTHSQKTETILLKHIFLEFF
jgi:hypothetical protein